MQADAIKIKYPEAIIREEKASAKSTHGRPMLELILDMIGEGDKLVVWKLDRLARNMKDLLKIVDRLKDKGANLEILDQAIDTSTASGNAFLQMLGVFAEFETNLRAERQLAGIEKAKKEKKYKGKPANEERLAKIKEMIAKNVSPTKISQELKISRSYVYKVKNEM
jgi:DNA invertase Pin-like site-specific DNA recombinase